MLSKEMVREDHAVLIELELIVKIKVINLKTIDDER